MWQSLMPWLMLPAVGALIGYGTNWLAIRMLFHPRQPRFGMQGLLPRRQQDLAVNVGRLVAEELVHDDALAGALHDIELRDYVAPLLDEVIADKMDELKKLPLIGAMLNPSMLDGLKRTILEAVDHRQAAVKARLAEEFAQRVDVAGIVRQRLEAFDLDQLEQAVRRIAHHELAAITWWGAVLGGLIGLFQALSLHLLAWAA
jgi:uncharacterized membrane protein YheB (UPF0754 family)